MASMYSVFNQQELDILRNLPEVLATQGTSCTNFKASVPESIKQKLQTSMGLDLSTVSDVPFRWIHGDTKPHVDRGQSSFENTYLVYLTDGDGEFEVGEESYPITVGTGFVFSEGTSHAVKNTNGTSRLLLGPMSEAGFPVGASTNINADGATDIVYISQEEGIIYYRIGNGSLNTITFPAYVNNVNEDKPNNILKVYFTTDITITGQNDFFVMSSGVQFGSETLKPDGSKYLITIDEVTDYVGFLATYGESHIYVYNLHVAAINGSTLDLQAGWIGSDQYGLSGTNNYVINCSSDGPISEQGGGIVGSRAGDSGGNLTIIGCSSSGTIGDEGGGIAGSRCGVNNGQVTISYCSSSGTIGAFGGGIVGKTCAENGNCEITRSYSTGAIGDDAGGIVGYNASDSSSQIANTTVSYSYSRGAIGSNGGGIYGANTIASNTGNATANNCYSFGVLTSEGDGIFGPTPSSESLSIINCYAADGNWVDADATAVLNMNYYQSVVTNQPYELKNFGPSPYSLRTIINNNLTTNFNKTTAVGSGIDSKLSEFSSYSILKINGNAPSQTPSITINSTTGRILTTRQTPLGVYTIIVRASGSPYTITTVTATLQETSSSPSLVSSSGAGTSNAQQGTRGLSAGDWTRIQRLRQSRTYATTLTTDKDIAPTPFRQRSQEHLTSSLKVVGTSKIRRPASSWTDYTASQTGDFVISALSSTTGTSVKNIVTRLCDCSPTTLLTKVGKCSKCDADYTLYPPLLCSQVTSPPTC
jgi:hypothetical protein